MNSPSDNYKMETTVIIRTLFPSFFDGSVRDLLEKLTELLNNNPEYSKLEIIRDEVYDPSLERYVPSFILVGTRLETEKEVKRRIKRELLTLKREEERERGQLRYLLGKYGLPEDENISCSS